MGRGTCLGKRDGQVDCDSALAHAAFAGGYDDDIFYAGEELLGVGHLDGA